MEVLDSASSVKSHLGLPRRSLHIGMNGLGLTRRRTLATFLVAGVMVALAACGGYELDEPARQACTLFVEIVQPVRRNEFPSPEDERAADQAVEKIVALASESEVQQLKDAAPLLDEEARTQSLFVDSRDYGSIVLQDMCPAAGDRSHADEDEQQR